MDTFITKELKRLDEKNLLRSCKVIDGPQGASVMMDGRMRLLLCSNDYLGLANHPLVKEAAAEGLKKYGAGAGASRLVSGTMAPHRELEERVKEYLSTEAALLFNSGYNANIGAITALGSRSTDIFSDHANHASIVDGCILSRANVKRYKSRDIASLTRLLESSTAERKLIITEGVFSMDGAVAPLSEMIPLLDRYSALLLLDDAHAIGTLGDGGRGTLEHLGLVHPSIIRVGTFGKALGTFGAFVAGSAEVIELLLSKARPFIYTTALPPAIAAATVKAIEIAEEGTELRTKLHRNAKYLREGFKSMGIDTLGSATQIIPAVVGSARAAMELSAALFDKDIFIQGIRPPTVPEGMARLRVTVTAAHELTDLDRALSTIKEVFSGANV
jgi:glycine C-acetyltransferase